MCLTFTRKAPKVCAREYINNRIVRVTVFDRELFWDDWWPHREYSLTQTWTSLHDPRQFFWKCISLTIGTILVRKKLDGVVAFVTKIPKCVANKMVFELLQVRKFRKISLCGKKMYNNPAIRVLFTLNRCCLARNYTVQIKMRWKVPNKNALKSFRKTQDDTHNEQLVHHKTFCKTTSGRQNK